MALFQAMEGIFTILFIISIGYYLTKIGWVNSEVSAFIPKLLTYVALPSLLFWNTTSILSKEQLFSLMYGLSIPSIAIFLNLMISVFLSSVLNLPSGRIGIFRAVCFSSNVLQIGIPVSLAFFGQAAVPYALLYYLINTLFFWTTGNYFIARDGKGEMSEAKLFSASSIKNIFSPPLLALIVALAVLLFNIPIAGFFMNTLRYLSNMTTPLALIFIGAVIFGIKLKNIRFSRDIFAALIMRFIISPSLILLAAYFIPIPEMMKKVFVIQSAVPSMIQVTILAKFYGADTEYAATLTALTIIFSVIFIPFYIAIV